MGRVILFNLIILSTLFSIEYRVAHLRSGMKLNVREIPVISPSTLIGRIPANAIGIKIRECKYAKDGKKWCYIFYPTGAKHIEGWVRAYYLTPLDISVTSYIYIKNFLKNFYLAEEENFLDKLKVFYDFPLQRYFDKYGVDYIQLRNSKVNFYKRWFNRKYRLLNVSILRRTDSYVDVRTIVEWKFYGKGSFQAGKDIQKIRLVYFGNAMKVKAIKNLEHIVYDSGYGKSNKNNNNINTNDNNNTNEINNNTTIQQNGYYIKVGSFFSEPNQKFLSNIVDSGFKYIIKDDLYNNNTIKRVYIGPYSTREEAEKFLQTVKEKVNKNAYIKSF